MNKHTFVTLAAVLLSSACVHPDTALPDAKERGLLSAKLANLSSAVDTYFSSLPQAPVDTDDAILSNSTRHDKRLLAAEFQRYLLKVQYQSPYAVVLLCSKDGRQAIMEDAGCSARIDHQVSAGAPCEFTLHVARGCAVAGADPQ